MYIRGKNCDHCYFSTQEEKDKWIEDLNEAVMQAKTKNEDKLKYASLKSSTSKSDNLPFLCPCIERMWAYCFTVVNQFAHLSVQT